MEESRIKLAYQMIKIKYRGRTHAFNPKDLHSTRTKTGANRNTKRPTNQEQYSIIHSVGGTAYTLSLRPAVGCSMTMSPTHRSYTVLDSYFIYRKSLVYSIPPNLSSAKFATCIGGPQRKEFAETFHWRQTTTDIIFAPDYSTSFHFLNI